MFVGFDWGTESSYCQTLFERCDDTADSPGVDHPFALVRKEIEVGVNGVEPFSGSSTSGWDSGSEYSAFLPDISGVLVHLDIPHLALTINDYNAVLARTNPSRPMLTPLTTLQDLKDLPGMLKDTGRLLKQVGKGKGLSVKDIANQNLATQFGWLPLIDDVRKLLDLQTHIDRRSKELKRLYSAKGLKRRINLDTGSAEQVNPRVLVHSGVTMASYKNVSYNTRGRKWGTVRWKPLTHPPVADDTEARNKLARKLLLGLTQEGLYKGAWDVLPWTWLTDWFVNVGDFMLAHSNTVPAVASNVCIMLQQDTTIGFSRHADSTPWTTGGDGVAYYRTKNRYNGALAPLASIPFIGAGRLSILGSLFIQRFK